jgi:two-component system, chemotaxis family, protein-glutamate methylesterase/glutaminase
MQKRDIIVIGTSAGGVEALRQLVASLTAGLSAAIFVVMHFPANSRSWLPELLSRSGPLPAKHPLSGEPIQPGHIYVAPPDHHLFLEEGKIQLLRGPKENNVRPAIDPLFRSAGSRVIGVILTGMLDDGTAGLLAVKMRGGLALIQDPGEAAYPQMPESAKRYVQIDYALPLSELGPTLVRLCQNSTLKKGKTVMSHSTDHESELVRQDITALEAG